MMTGDVTDSTFLSSKEILDRSGISRATLNNYIKLGLIPKPVVKRPEEPYRHIRSLGYFPVSVLDTLRLVKSMKKRGRSMESIAMEIGDLPKRDLRKEMKAEPDSFIHTAPVTFPLEGLDDCAYLLDFDFDMIWMNRTAERDLFHHRVAGTDPSESRNIFRLIFKREFREHIRNWKDLITFHMSFAKIKYARTWLKRFYKGISYTEVRLLENAYDDTEIFHGQAVQETPIDLKNVDGSVECYSVFSIFFNEGILFIYRKRTQGA